MTKTTATKTMNNMIQIPIEIGDIVRVGRFKNKKITVKEIGVDENNHPTINGRGILKIRIEKLMPSKEPKTEIQEVTGKQPIKFIGFRKNNEGKIVEYIESITQDLGKEFKGPVVKFGFLSQFTGLKGSKEKGWFRVNKSNIRWEKYGVIWEEGMINLDIKQDIQENEMNKPNKAKLDKMILRLIKEEYPLGKIEKSFEFLEDKNPIKVKFQEKNGRHWIIQEESENVLGSAAGYETKDTARQSALILGFHFEGVEDMQGKVPEIPKLTKAEPVKHDKPEEVKLDKEKELKMEILRIAKRVIKEEISKKKDNLKEDFPLINLTKPKLVSKNHLVQEADVADKPELEAKARRFAELANKMKEMEAELKNMEKEYTELDQEFRPLLESIGTTKDTFIRAGKLLIKIERAGYEKGSSSYKTGFDYLYSKVNGTMKQLADEALEMTKTVSYVKSKIAVVQGESVIKEESWFGKIKNFITSKIKKLFGTNQKANAELDKLEAMF